VLAGRPTITLHLVGGQVRGRTMAAVGQWAEQALTAIYVDVAFVGTNGISRARGLTTPDVAEAAVKRAQAQRDYNQLVAPADGIVLRRDGEPGQFVAAGQAVLTLACCAPLRVSAEVDEEDIPRVVVGQKVTLRTDALPGRLFDGEVADITPKGDPVSRSYRVRIRLADAPAVDAGPLREVHDWTATYEEFWAERIDRLRRRLDG